MDSLNGEAAGIYAVTTMSAVYLLDLDRMLLIRTPADADVPWRRLRGDEEPVKLLAIVRCRIGEPMHLNINLRPRRHFHPTQHYPRHRDPEAGRHRTGTPPY